MAQVDSLDIQISAQVNKANASLTTLINRLDRVSASLSGVNTSGLATMGAGVNKLANAMSNFSKNTKTADFSRLSRNLASISSINTSKLSEISSKMSQLSSVFDSTKGIDTSGISNIASSISKLGGKSAIAGVDNLLKIKDGLSQFVSGMNSVGSLTFDASSLSNLLDGISRLGGKTATEAVKNLPPISAQLQNLVRQLNNIGSLKFDTTNLSNLINGIARLGGKGATNATANIPLLATALKNLMQTLSTAPKVSQNVIQMTNALANLASQGGKVSVASRTMVSGLNNTSHAMNRAKKSSLGLAAAFGKFYATWFLAIRGIKGFMKSVESTTDYIEAYNYYNVAFGKIASEWDKDFEKYGYDNAESYAESFTKRMNETLGKLSGVQVNLETGLLEETGLQNLGLNIQEITQYASQLASVTNSIGQTGEVSLAAAKSMTMLAGDISSLFNIDFSDVAKNLQSGLIGQSRALYKYGIDITNATLATYAYNLGIEKSVSDMTQAEKMQLRMLAILDQSKVSWGDLANTISSPSNMLRQFTNNVKELGMVFGQLFIPVLQKVMPIINGVVIAIKRLIVSIAGLLGIKIDYDSFGQGYNNMADGAEDLSDSLDDVAKSAKKAKSYLLDIDELNVIEPAEDSGAGSGAIGGGIDLTDEILGATEEYEKVWNEAFANMENIAQAWADKIEKMLAPIKKIFEDFAVGDFFQAGKDVSSLLSSIADFFANAIRNTDWIGIGSSIADFFNGAINPDTFRKVGETIAASLNAALDLLRGFGEEFDFKNLGESISEGVNGFFEEFDFGDLANTLDAWVLGIKDALISAINGIKWSEVWAGAIEFLTELDIETVTIALGAIWWKFQGKKMALAAIGKLLSKQIATGIGLSTVSVSTALSISIAAAIIGFKVGNWMYENVLGIQNISDAIGEWIFKDGEEIAIARGLSVVLGSLSISLGGLAIYEGIKGIITSAVAKAGAEAALSGTGIGAIVLAKIGTAISAAGTAISGIASSIGGAISTAVASAGGWAAIATGAATLVGSVFAAIGAAIAGWNIGQWLYEQITGDEITMTFKEQMQTIADAIGDGIIKDAFALWWEDIKAGFAAGWQFVKDLSIDVWNDIVNALFGLWNNLSTTASKVFTAIKTTISNIWNNVKVFTTTAWNDLKTFVSNLWSGILSTALNVFNVIKTTISNIWNNVKTVTSTVWNGIQTFISGLWSGISTTASKVFTAIKTTISNIWNGISTTTTNVWNGIVATIKSAVNSIIGFINGMINGVVSGINSMINALNSISFDVPDWVPGGMGGKSFGLNLSTVSAQQIPYLANGAVFKGGNPYLAWVNDQPYGQTNIEAPLDTIRQALREEMYAQDYSYFEANSGDNIKGMIREAVHEEASYLVQALTPYLGDISQNTRETADKDMSVQIGDRDIARANQRGLKEMGWALIT